MVLEGERPGDGAGTRVRNRISRTPNADGSVRQHRQVGKGADSWQTILDGLHRRDA